jgi:cytochrome c biogenesis protein CcmG/thiol:disulfide interchange protein DsbE
VNRKAFLVGLLVAAPLLAVLAVSFRFDPKTVASPLVGKPAPHFALTDLSGQVHRLEDLLGQPVVINFWATYCPPCYDEHPVFLTAAERYRGRVHFLGVIYQDDPALIARWEEQLGAWGPTLVDREGTVAIAYGVYGPPETFFIGRDGRIEEKIIGGVSERAMEEILGGLL